MERNGPKTAARRDGQGDWLRVEGRSVAQDPIYTGVMRVMGEVAYHLMGRDPRSGLVACDVVVPGRLSRSGQPGRLGWQQLRGHGVRTIVNLRMEDDGARRLRELGFSGYLHLPIPDGLPPTERQAIAFLRFVTDAAHQPAHLHCLSGIQRSGILSALLWYAVEGWPMDVALRSAFRHWLRPTRPQRCWLRGWAQRHDPGEWAWEDETGQ